MKNQKGTTSEKTYAGVLRQAQNHSQRTFSGYQGNSCRQYQSQQMPAFSRCDQTAPKWNLEDETDAFLFKIESKVINFRFPENSRHPITYHFLRYVRNMILTKNPLFAVVTKYQFGRFQNDNLVGKKIYFGLDCIMKAGRNMEKTLILAYGICSNAEFRTNISNTTCRTTTSVAIECSEGSKKECAHEVSVMIPVEQKFVVDRNRTGIFKLNDHCIFNAVSPKDHDTMFNKVDVDAMYYECQNRQERRDYLRSYYDY